jgi:hypothetical protein
MWEIPGMSRNYKVRGKGKCDMRRTGEKSPRHCSRAGEAGGGFEKDFLLDEGAMCLSIRRKK